MSVIGPNDFGPIAVVETFDTHPYADFGHGGFYGRYIKNNVSYYIPSTARTGNGEVFDFYLSTDSGEGNAGVNDSFNNLWSEQTDIILGTPAGRVGGYLFSRASDHPEVFYYDSNGALLGSTSAVLLNATTGLFFFGFQSDINNIETINIFANKDHVWYAGYQLDNFTYEIFTPPPVVTENLTHDTGSLSSDNITKDAALTGGSDANAVVTLKEGGTTLGTATANGNGIWSFTPTGLADGPHTIIASETNAAGNTGTASLTFTLDTTAPVVAFTAQILLHDTGFFSTDRITNDGHVTLAGTVSDNNAVAGVEIFDGSTDLGAATISGGTWSFAYNLGAGTHALYAIAADAAGNITTTAAQPTIIVDQTAPAPVITSEVVSKNGAVTLTGSTAEANDSISVYDGTTLLGTTTTAGNGTWSFTTGKASNVVHIYTASATDVAGNIGLSKNEAILGGPTAALVGTSGNDIIIGSGGNNTITGGLGADDLTGGSGKATFVYNAISDSTPSSHDTITNFRHGQDQIDFTNIAGINASGGVATFQGQLTGTGSLTLNAHSVAFIEVSGNTVVLVNATNSAETVTSANVGEANIEIVLTGIHLGLTSADFHHV